MKSDDQHEIAVREVHAVSHYQSVLLSQFFNLQQLHKYYRFFDYYIQLLANEFTQDEKES